MPIERAISEFRFAYGTNRNAAQMDPPPNTPGLEVSAHLATLFERAFAPLGAKGGRPTASEWMAALATVETQTRRCAVNASHYYVGTLQRCPWCQAEAATGVVFFNVTVQVVHGGTSFDVRAAWARITAIEDPGHAPAVPAHVGLARIVPSPEAAALGRGHRQHLALQVAVCIGVVVASLAYPQGCFLWGIAGLVIAGIIGSRSSNRPEVVAFKMKCVSAEALHKRALARWEAEASPASFRAKLAELEGAKREWINLPITRQTRYHELERGRERQQRRSFLERHQVEDATISGIGAGRKAMLASYNVETAWDVSEASVCAVPGFGPALTERLLDWRRDIERKFRFDSTKAVDPNEIAALDRDIADTKRRLEQRLLSGAAELGQVRNQVLMARQVLPPQVEEAHRSVLQAQADLKAMGA
jgi:DNA-binding helix-hairpin-helix protein with protein kinase domain